MATIQVRRFSSAQEFLEECREWLLQEEVANTQLLAFARRYADQGEVSQGSCFSAEVKLGVARLAVCFHSPGRPLLLASPALPEALGPLAREWVLALGEDTARAGRRVLGQPAHALAFAQAAAKLLGPGQVIRPRLEMKILRIQSPPAGSVSVGGMTRLAVAEELPQLIRWGVSFAKDAGLLDTPAQVADRFSAAYQRGELLVWEDIGELRSNCLLSWTGTGSARIAAVYTPPAERGQGYGSAIVAEVARKAFAEGAKQVSLYVEKPEVRRLYERIGFTLAGEATEYEIVSG